MIRLTIWIDNGGFDQDKIQRTGTALDLLLKDLQVRHKVTILPDDMPTVQAGTGSGNGVKGTVE